MAKRFIGGGTIDVNLDASEVVSGTLDAARVPNLSANKITTDVLNASRVPNLDAAKIASGTINVDRVPNLDASKIASGTLNSARLPLATGSNAGAVKLQGASTLLTAISTTIANVKITAPSTGWYFATGTGYIDIYNGGFIRAATITFYIDGEADSNIPVGYYNSSRLGGTGITNYASPFLSTLVYLEVGQVISLALSNLGNFYKCNISLLPIGLVE